MAFFMQLLLWSLMQSAHITFGMRLTNGGALAGNSSAEMSARIKSGSLLLNQYRLVSLMKTSAWPGGPFKGYEKLSYLGKGAFGETWLAFDVKRQAKVAVKFFYRADRHGNVGMLLNNNNANMQERRLLQEAGNECDTPTSIIKAKRFPAGQARFARCLENAVKHQLYSHLVLEVAGSDTLEEYVKQIGGGLSSSYLIRIAKMMLEGLVQMEGAYVHRDIKPANIMVYKDTEDQELYLRYIDFGLVVREGAVDGASGTPMFMPPETWPEVPRSVKFTHAFDIYSAGETIYSLICGRTFHEYIFDEYGNRGERQIAQALRSVRPGTYCNPRQSLKAIFSLVVEGMMGPANTRATASALLQNPIFDGIVTVKVVKVVEDKKPILHVVAPVVQMPVVPKKQEPTFLDKCHASKKFWFRNANECCLKARYDPIRHAYCERPCGPNVAYDSRRGQCEKNCQVTSNSDQMFSEELQCCVATVWPTKCIYRDYIPNSGEGWGWLH
jgi:serine/threonine protein kinase